MLRKVLGPAIVLGLSLLAASAYADEPSEPEEQAPAVPEAQSFPGLHMTITGDADESAEDDQAEAEFVVTDGLLDHTVALDEGVQGLPDTMTFNAWSSEGDMKIAGVFQASGYDLSYKMEGGSVMLRTEGIDLQTPVDAAGAMTFASDMANLGLQSLSD